MMTAPLAIPRRLLRLRSLIAGVGVFGLLGALGFAVLAWRSVIAPIAQPSRASFAVELVNKGETLASAGYCAECHTVKGGPAFAGGYAMSTPFGILYSTNITPDPETGIGAWSEAAFARAMREGIARDGSHLFPAFPYDHFSKLSDADVRALYPYFMTREAVRAPARANQLLFPLNARPLQAGWKLLFFRPGRFQPDLSRSAQWNRGAYLVEGVNHCGACHTPRNVLGAETTRHAYEGAPVNNWIAPSLTSTNPAPAPWTQAELYSYLRNGASVLHGTAVGPMAPVAHGLRALPGSDIEAIANYLADIDQAGDRAASTGAAVARAMSYAVLGAGQDSNQDARLYMSACASCHYNSGRAPLLARPDLALNSAVNLADPSNLVQVMLRGVGAQQGEGGAVMPSFAALSDSDIARVAAYLRRTRTNLPPWRDLETDIASVRRQMAAPR